MGWEFDLLCLVRVAVSLVAHSQMKSLYLSLESAVSFYSLLSLSLFAMSAPYI